MARSSLKFLLNGRPIVVDHPDPSITILEYLPTVGLTGTKYACGEGGCGACTVMISRFERGEVRHYSVNACLTLLCSVDGCHITTVEGIGSPDDPHPVQERIAKLHGSQCGYCTPGIVMALYSRLADTPKPTVRDIEESFDGNLCRCTGYRPIVDAAYTFASDAADEVPDACRACPNKTECLSRDTAVMIGSNTAAKVADAKDGAQFVPFDPADKHKPPMLPQEYAATARDELEIHCTNAAGRRTSWYRPATLEQLLAIIKEFPYAKIIGGNSEAGVEVHVLKKHVAKPDHYRTLVSVANVTQLHELRVDDTGNDLVIGAGVTLTALKRFIADSPLTGDPLKSMNVLAALHRIIEWYASQHIRNVATVGGNVCTGSPISDLMPVLIAVDAMFVVKLADGAERAVPARQWLRGYRQTALQPGDVLLHIRVPLANSGGKMFVNAYKQCRRRDDDISIVTAAFRATVNVTQGDETGSARVTVASLEAGLGGMAATTIPCTDLAQAVVGESLPLGEAALQRLREVVYKSKTLSLKPGVPGGMAAYRMTLVVSMCHRFLMDVERHARGGQQPLTDTDGADSYMSRQRPATHGTQQFAIDQVPQERPSNDDCSTGEVGVSRDRAYRGPVGEPHRHAAALLHSTGRAKYTLDEAVPERTLHACPVYATRPTGKFRIEDLSGVMALPGVRDVITAKDCPGARNRVGTVGLDEQLFREDTVTGQGQLIALVLAGTPQQGIHGAAAVPVTYEDRTEAPKPIVSIQQAVDAGSFLPDTPTVELGDVQGAFNRPGVVSVDGVVRIGGQEHFYMENHNSLAVPRDDGNEVEVLCASQSLELSQRLISIATGLPNHRVKCTVKRMGGGFGGKESRSAYIAAVAAVAATKTKTAVKLSLERNADMLSTGTRHPFRCEFRIGVDPTTLKIVAYDVELFSNAGWGADLSVSVMCHAIMHTGNAYCLENMRATGHVCKTASSNNTSFRGFGVPQAVVTLENAIEAVAAELGVPPSEIRRRNLLHEGDLLPYRQPLAVPHIPRMWAQMHSPEYGNVASREAAIAEFNATHTYVKRGLSVVPSCYGISFKTKFLDQGGCNVIVYKDGTVRVSSGAVEMGQGIHTKLCQVVATTLAIPLANVHVADTSTAQIPNTSSSAASVTFDIYGAAALNACKKLNSRLAPFLPTDWHTTDFPAERRGEAFAKAVTDAYFERVDLFAHGFYEANYDYDWNAPPSERSTTPCAYHTTGICCAEVELDVLTGDMRVLRADVLMDLGVSPNPAIDIGQIEGAVVQGIGLFTLEETVWGSPDEHSWIEAGSCFTRGPSSYKIPSFNDVPVDMRVTLLADAPNPRAVFSSKAVGEPPLVLGAAALFASRNAARAARADSGCDTPEALRDLDTPVSVERLRMFCNDSTASYFSQCNVEAGGLSRPALFS